MSHRDAARSLRRNGRTFHLASLLLPGRMRHDATELYAFCRRMDDLADSGGDHSLRLHAVADQLKQDGEAAEAQALGWPIELERRHPGIARIAAELTAALARDTGPVALADEKELLHYAWGVAGTVGLMMRRVLGAPARADRAAEALGMAMQCTNIARDVGEDRERGRFYLPAAWMQPQELLKALADQGDSADQERLATATQQLLALADRLYLEADRGMSLLPWRARLGILAAAACYREIGYVVARDIPASWRRRAVVPGWRKAVLVLQAAARSLRPQARPSSATRRAQA